jgi:hypothetical protein
MHWTSKTCIENGGDTKPEEGFGLSPYGAAFDIIPEEVMKDEDTIAHVL